MPIKAAIAFAFDVYDYQLVGGPKWMGSDVWDILAKPPAGEEVSDLRSLSESQAAAHVNKIRRRVQSLLKDRFQLVYRREVREMPIYELVIAKGGSKLQPPKDGGDGRDGIGGGPKGLTGTKATMDMLATVLSRTVGRPVRNVTGLTGTFDFTLEFQRDLAPPSDENANQPGGASLFAALQEQLGLKLESKRGPADIIVIDRLEKPSEN
jgi:uncharacterized protein (TIGR03435 family)